MSADGVDRPKRQPDDPQRFEGRYADQYGMGCRTCGWRVPNGPGVEELWSAHDHDPFIDIEERVLAGQRVFTADDVVFLLALIKPEHWARQPVDSEGVS